jgi:hypothetical protein
MEVEMKIDEIKMDVDKFIEEIDREFYLAFSGKKEGLDSSSIIERFSHLNDIDLYKDIDGKLDKKSNGREERFLREFIAYFIQGYDSREIEDKIQNQESSTNTEIDGEEVGYYQLPVIIQNTDDRESRLKISEEYQKIAEKFLPIYKENWETKIAQVNQFGFKNTVDFVEEMGDIDLEVFLEALDEFADKTCDVFRDALKFQLEKRVNIGIEESATHDISYIMRGKWFDDVFPADELLPIVRKWSDTWGFDITAGGNIEFDTEDRPKKYPRAFCSPVVVPSDVKLVIKPTGGITDYSAFMHELGHACHFGYTSAELEVVYKRLGDNSVTEGFAFLFEHLLMNRIWLDRFTDIQNIDDYMRFVYFNYLFMLRRYIAKLRYELVFFSDDKIETRRDIYKDTLEKYTLVETPSVRFLTDIDDNFYVARYLRAWFFEAQLQDYLKNEYDEDWFINPEAQSFLKNLYSLGQKFTADELLQDMGYDGLDTSYLEKQIINHLG